METSGNLGRAKEKYTSRVIIRAPPRSSRVKDPDTDANSLMCLRYVITGYLVPTLSPSVSSAQLCSLGHVSVMTRRLEEVSSGQSEFKVIKRFEK